MCNSRCGTARVRPGTDTATGYDLCVISLHTVLDADGRVVATKGGPPSRPTRGSVLAPRVWNRRMVRRAELAA